MVFQAVGEVVFVMHIKKELVREVPIVSTLIIRLKNPSLSIITTVKQKCARDMKIRIAKDLQFMLRMLLISVGTGVEAGAIAIAQAKTKGDMQFAMVETEKMNSVGAGLEAGATVTAAAEAEVEVEVGEGTGAEVGEVESS